MPVAEPTTQDYLELDKVVLDVIDKMLRNGKPTPSLAVAEQVDETLSAAPLARGFSPGDVSYRIAILLAGGDIGVNSELELTVTRPQKAAS